MIRLILILQDHTWVILSHAFHFWVLQEPHQGKLVKYIEITNELLLHGGAKLGLEFFVEKIMQKLINNITRINSVSCTHTSKHTFAPLYTVASGIFIQLQEKPWVY